MTMAKSQGHSEDLTATVAQAAEQTVERVQGTTENYFSWLQKTMSSSSSPWGDTDLNKKLLSYWTQNATAAFGFMQNLSQAKNFQDVTKIQTEFMEAQLKSFNEQAKEIGEIYTKAAGGAFKMPPFNMSS
jgi:hypothetical protein